MKLLSEANPKIVKGEKYGYLTKILHLAPHKSSGFNVCKNASKGCSEACLFYQGRGQMTSVQKARLRKTEMFFENKSEFMDTLHKEIKQTMKQAERKNMTPAIRLNGTSDIPWERVKYGNHKNVFEAFPDLQFYDYTKRTDRKDLPSNYHVTFSLSEDNDEAAKEALKNGMNVAVVFRDELPKTFWGYPVYDGDDTDLRFLDPQGHVIGLKAKGSAKKDTSGFVR